MPEAEWNEHIYSKCFKYTGITSWGSSAKCASPSDTEQALRALRALPGRGPSSPLPQTHHQVTAMASELPQVCHKPHSKDKSRISKPQGKKTTRTL